MRVTVYFITGFMLGVPCTNGCSSLPDYLIEEDTTRWPNEPVPRSIAFQRNVEDQQDIYTRRSSNIISSKKKPFERNCTRDKAIGFQLSDQACSSKIGGIGNEQSYSDVKPKLKPENVPKTSKSVSEFQRNKERFHNDNIKATKSWLDQCPDSEMRLQSLPMPTEDFNPSDIGQKPSKEKAIQRQEIKQVPEPKRREKERDRSNHFHTDKRENGILNVKDDTKVSIDFQLPCPSTSYSRNEGSPPNLALAAGRKNQIKYNSTKDSDLVSGITNGNNKSILKPILNTEIRNDNQIELSSKEDTPNLRRTQPSSQDFLSDNDANKSITRYQLQLGTSPHSTLRNPTSKNSNTYQRFAATLQRESENIENNPIAVTKEKPDNTILDSNASEEVIECDGDDCSDDCSSDEDETIQNFVNTKKPNVAGARARVNEGERKAREILKKFNLEENEPESSKQNLDQLRQVNKALKESKLCKVCRDKDANRLFLPCAHLACCSLCSPAVRSCPQCKSNIRGIVSVYFG